ncbi:ketoacyl-ACP synthase III, partial [Serratia marcescens]|nr:ketoacyl-ACP synthase III [Serratia marcescens]
MTTQCRSPELLPLKIIAPGAALPPNRGASSTLDARLGKPAGYVEKRSGIVDRYHADDDASQAELAAAALQDALARSTIPAASIDL